MIIGVDKSIVINNITFFVLECKLSIPEEILMHDILQEDASDPNNGAAALKHINQQVRNKQCSPNLGYKSAIHLPAY